MIPGQAEAIRAMTEAGVADPTGDYRRLYDWAYGKGEEDPEPQTREAPNDWTLYLLKDAVDARVARQPVSQIIGTRAFWEHAFEVTPDVLDPRPDTETLVEAALSRPFDHVLDIGTGSGCILLSLLAARPTARGIGVDISEPALAVARRNAATLDLTDRSEFRRSDWLAEVPEQFDLIVSNPPYIDAATYASLAPEVQHWEPRSALEAGEDGLDAYRAIAAQAPRALKAGGRLLLEIGHDQGQSVPKLLAGAGIETVNVLKDLNGKDRVVIANLI
ncbi:peptide chain release factor N(5)-glutamine methyltransferase [Dinoroseobacter sp. S76]|uniref:peptide chain release factor N(5)-glutamine methyltransferase n=1 Tax=Dinoroseobacter sp. S76 TaxID=3415124 RepID=UPI003C7B89DC